MQIDEQIEEREKEEIEELEKLLEKSDEELGLSEDVNTFCYAYYMGK